MNRGIIIGVKLLKLYMKNYMILLSMDVGVHFV